MKILQKNKVINPHPFVNSFDLYKSKKYSLSVNGTSLEQKAHLALALEAAKRGGVVLKKYWGAINSIAHKDTPIDLVTDADRASEEAIIHSIKSAYPTHGILAEESGMHVRLDEDFLWVIDPLDGTTNYTHQYPVVAVSIALLYQGKPVLGVVYNPILNELFHAAQGEGAFFNGKAIHVSHVDSLSRSLLASGFAYDRRENPENNYGPFCRLTHLTQGVRRGGAAALDIAYVAAGRLEGYWERGIKPWDIAAGIILVQEAGGKVSAYDEGPFDLASGKILATNGKIHNELSREICKAISIGISL